MEEGEGTTNLDEQPQSSHNEPAAESEVDQSTHSAESWISPILYPVMEEQLLPQLPTYENATGERARCSARGEPAAHISPPVQDPTLSTCRHIVGLLGQITEYRKYWKFSLGVTTLLLPVPSHFNALLSDFKFKHISLEKVLNIQQLIGMINIRR